MTIRTSFLLGLSCAVLCAQEPAPTVSPTPSPSASPSPTATPEPTPTPTPEPELTLRQKVDKLKDEEVAKAVAAIKEKFLDREKISDAAIQRAELEGLASRLGPGAQLVDVTRKAPETEATPFLAEIIDEHIGYLRIGSVEPDTLPQIDAAITGFTAKKVDSVILDLRGAAPGGNFETAADIARRFCAKGKLLFSIQKPSAKQERIYTSNQDPAFSGVLVVLVDGDTSGAAEILAATLRQNASAMVIGETTVGAAAEFIDVPVSGNLAVRVAVAQVMLPDIGSIFPDGVSPDVVISMPRSLLEQIFRESKEKGVSQFVFENERRRMNEASLVANLNPEIDSAQALQRERNRRDPVRDVVLQRAVDLITAIDFYKNKPTR